MSTLYRLPDPSRLRAYEADGGANPTAGTSPAGENGNATGQENPANGGKVEKTFTQAELDAIISDRLAREEKKRTEAADKAAKAAQEKTLQEQGEFKTLAEQRAQALAEAQAKLEAAAGEKKTAERYQAALKSHVEGLLKDAPKHLTALLAKLDPAEQLEWITANPDALKPSAGAQQTQQRAARGTPGVGGQQGQRPAPQAQGQEPATPRKRVTL